MFRYKLLFWLQWPLLMTTGTTLVGAELNCVRDVDCEARLEGSVCQTGRCVSPYYNKGCFAQKGLNQYHRVCHSEDPPEAVTQGLCRKPDPGLEYAEVRIFTQNWESVFMEAWILQIVLSEVLGVPTTIETGDPNVNLDFFAQRGDFGYGTSNDWEALRRAATNGDCRKVPRFDDQGNYQACAHVIPEVWINHMKKVQRLNAEGIVEPPLGLGVVGQQSWFIPKFTGQRDPSLLTYLGLQGNRRKLAETFKRPTTWGEYCSLVSVTRCQSPDGVAERAPATDDERNRLHVPGLYIGHFRGTEENDCQKWPQNCTGHIADFPCGWLSNIEQQTHHLDIALKSSGPDFGAGGWSYSSLLEMWAAANATKSDIMMQWWSPDTLYQKYLNTEAEMQMVTLPPPTQKCVQARIELEDRCDEDSIVRVGNPDGACMEPAYPLQKVVSQSLYEMTNHIDPAKRSPAYESIKAFTISSLQLGELFDLWTQRMTATDDHPGFDLRAATCDWLVANWEEIESQVVPRTYPRVTKDNASQYQETFFFVSLGLAGVALVSVVITTAVVFQMRNRRVIRYAQIEFLWLLLAGLLLVSLGAILSVLPPTNATCITTIWLTNVGYTLELVPLIVKVAAIQKIMSAARQMKRVKLDRKYLFSVVFGLSGLVVVFLAIWTALDAPYKQSNYELSDSKTDQGETIVLMSHFCQSNSDIWRYLSALWHSLLLLTATVLAFQTRKLQTEFKENQSLALMIYSHFVFVCLRMITFSLESGENEADIVRYRSLIYSCDAITTILVYFCTKVFAKTEDSHSEDNHRTSSHLTVNGFHGSLHNRGGMGNTPGFSGATSVSIGAAGSAKQKPFIHSIMEGSCESDSDGSFHAESSTQPGGVEQPKSSVSDVEEDTEERFQAYLEQHVTGLRCRNCGHAYSRQSKV